MKIALCLSGQMRFIQRGFVEVIHPYILENNTVDVFIHSWDITPDQVGSKFLAGNIHPIGELITQDLTSQTLNLYKPVSHVFEEQINFPELPHTDNHLPGFFSKNVYSMFYSIYQSNKLKSEYEQLHNFKYDYVVRSRFDVKLNSKVNFDEFDSNVLNVPSGCFDPVNGYVDCFAFAKSDIMDVYSNLYNHLDQYINDTSSRLCGEYILKRHIDSNNIPVVNTVWHSLFR